MSLRRAVAAVRRPFARWVVLRAPGAPGRPLFRVPIGLALGRSLEWSPDEDGVEGLGETGSVRSVPRIALQLPDPAALGAVGRHPVALIGVRQVRIEIAWWRAPFKGWSGRLGSIPGLVSSEVRLPRVGGGRVRISVELAAERPLREIIAATDGVLLPGSGLPVTHASAVGSHGRLPSWLPVGADAAARFAVPPGAPVEPGIDPVSGRARMPDDPPPNRPAVDAELVMDDATPVGLGLIPAPVVRVTGPGLLLETTSGAVVEGGGPVIRILADVRGEHHPWSSPGPSGRQIVVEVRDTPAGPRWRPRVRSTAPAGTGTDGAPVGPWRDLDVPLTRADPTEYATWWSVAWDIGDGVDPAVAASAVVRAALGGVVVDGQGLPLSVRERLAPELAGILEGPRPAIDDPFAWERRSVSQRRAAVRGHATSLNLDQALRPEAVVPSSPPTVSALIVTRRPHLAASALRAMTRQTYPRLEVVLALHGVAADEALRGEMAGSGLPIELLEVTVEATLGEALALATARARGSLVTKVDDDDIYGPEHIWDLVVGRAVSGATVIGKPSQFVLLDRMGITVRRERPSADVFGRVVAGGSMLLSRGELEGLGGWRPVPSGVDRALLDRVLHAGGTIFQTSPIGFIYRRHGQGHTWDVDDSYFLRGAIGRWEGIPDLPEFGDSQPVSMTTGL